MIAPAPTAKVTAKSAVTMAMRTKEPGSVSTTPFSQVAWANVWTVLLCQNATSIPVTTATAR